MLEKVDIEAPFRVTDLKQWVYCPRILYYAVCLPNVRPVTYKMQAGVEAGRDEEGKEARRGLRAYGLEEGQRKFNVSLVSDRLGLRGLVDMVIWLEDKGEVIPVDYKLSDRIGAAQIAGIHFKLQLAAYGLMLEEVSGLAARRGFLYSIPRRKAEEVPLDKRMRDRLAATLDAMHRMLRYETMPEPTPQRAKCVACEFRRFCNDVF
ncbi:MAG: CRISPR-associated protein Cas4 [Anaerolineales bacterium]|nr:CRISPR-associated protein Cas4 [Anaerolineales bacterium]